jgi:hypothetical protein
MEQLEFEIGNQGGNLANQAKQRRRPIPDIFFKCQQNDTILSYSI